MRNEQKDSMWSQPVIAGRLGRRSILKRAVALGVTTPAAMSLLAACGGDDSSEPTTEPAAAGSDPTEVDTTADEPEETSTASDETTDVPTEGEDDDDEDSTPSQDGEGVRGGTLRVAQFEEAITLDIHTSAHRETALPAWLIYESLFAWSDTFDVIPMLAESYEVSDDGLLQSVKVRQGVPFHNGQELVAADVVASVQRWGTRNSIGREMLELVEEITAVDDYTVEFSFTKPYSMFAGALGLFTQGCAIYPESVVAAAGDDDVSEYIGTGPYKLASWDRGQSIRLERFEDYAALPGAPNGYGGHKHAYLDAIEIVAVTDEAARVAGVRSGDYQVVERISGDQVPSLEGDENVKVTTVPASGSDIFILNWRSPLTSNLKIRQAIQAALDHTPILEAGRGAGYYELYPSLMPEGSVWFTEAGGEAYNQGDLDKARQLLEESGYDGTPLRLMTTQADLTKYQPSVVIKQQLEDVGFTVDLQVYDWATVTERRNEEDLWEGLVTVTTFKPDPVMLNPMKLCDYAGWWCSDDSAAALEGLLTEMDLEGRYSYWEQLQTLLFEEIPVVFLGQTSNIFAQSASLQGVTSQAQIVTILWNAWFQE